MIPPDAFYAALKRNGVSFFTGVPDSLLKEFCAHVNAVVPTSDHVINSSEGSAIAMAAGYHLGTGRMPAVYLQNSGLGNTVNPLLSLADAGVYAIPMLLIIGWRGEPGKHDEPQHMRQGSITTDMLDVLGVGYDVIGPDSAEFADIIESAVTTAMAASRPRALLIRSGTFTASRGEPAERPPGLTRPDAVELVMRALDPDDFVVSTTGMTSREVYAFRERHGDGHAQDFLTVGSMGHASQIALGIAMSSPTRKVICLDGDGAALMHMGSLAIIGSQQPSNLRHIVINNGAHDSVGGQPTAALNIDLAAVAEACGYANVLRARTSLEAADAIAALRDGPGPGFLEIRTLSYPYTDAGRPTTSPLENKEAFMQAIGHEGE